MKTVFIQWEVASRNIRGIRRNSLGNDSRHLTTSFCVNGQLKTRSFGHEKPAAYRATRARRVAVSAGL